MRKLGSWGIIVTVIAIAMTGCAATPPASLASTSTVPEASASANASASPSATSTPVEVDPATVDWVGELGATDPSVVAVDQPTPGDLTVRTDLTNDTSVGGATSLSAMALCERAVDLGATRVQIAAVDGKSLVVYGDPEYGDLCTEVPLVAP